MRAAARAIGAIRTAVWIVAALLAAVPSIADAQSKKAGLGPSRAFEQCMEKVDLGAFKNSQWSNCYGAELQLQDVTLNSVYRNLRSQLEPSAQAKLVLGQRSWLAFREAWCRYEETDSSAPGGEVNYQACLLEITLSHIQKLKSLAGLQ